MFSATLSIVAAICTILGFVIGPGMTHVRPWLMEKFSSDKQEATKNMLAKDYNNMSRGELLLEKIHSLITSIDSIIERKLEIVEKN